METETQNPALASDVPRMSAQDSSMTTIELAHIIDAEKERQAALPPARVKSEFWGPCKIGKTLDAVLEDALNKLPPPRELTPEEIDAENIRAEAVRKNEIYASRKQEECSFLKQVGMRYNGATFENYTTCTNNQRNTVDLLKAYIEDFSSQLANGRGIILYGSSGTGKDHLLVACGLGVIVAHGTKIKWLNGLDYFGQVRDAMGCDHQTELGLIRHYTQSDVLIISDPLPPRGPLTDFQAGMLFRLLDVRYRDCKPTWVSINAKDRDEMDERLGAQLVDRLRHNAVCINCNWPSYRKAFKNL